MTAATPVQQVSSRTSARDKSIARTRWCGHALGAIVTGFILADLLRPPFVAVNAESEASSHVVPVVVTVLHLVLNMAVIVPPILLALVEPVELKRLGTFPIWAGGLVLIALLSLIGVDLKAYAYVFTLALTFAAGSLLAATRYGRTVGAEALISTTAIGCGFALVIAIGMNEYNWGRLASRAGPTYWGMVALMAFSMAPAIRRRALRAGVVVVACAAFVLCSARGGMVASAMAALVWVAITLRVAPSRQRGWIIAVIMGGLVVSPVTLAWIGDHLLELSDARRGIGSGATGRAAAWAQAWQLFVDHPWLGVGYRQHEHYITAATSAHQAYLAVLAELGVIGFALYLILLLGALANAVIRATREPISRISFALASFFTAYLVIGFTENLALATGLAMPVAMMLLSPIAWSRDMRQTRGGAPPRRSSRHRSNMRRETAFMPGIYGAEPDIRVVDDGKMRS